MISTLPASIRSASSVPAAVLLIALLASCSPSGNADTEGVDEDGYKLVWRDDFSGSKIDRSNWGFQNGTGSDVGLVGWGNNESQYYTDREKNAYLENGFLVIEAHREDFQGKPYTSARLVTKDKRSWTYGRFEMRAKLPKTQGIWPAFWMLPADNAYGGWPASGEIDIMELVGHTPEIAYGTVHFGNSFQDRSYITGEISLPQGDFSQDFHLFSIEWEPDSIRWSMDDKVYHAVNKASLAPYSWPFDKPFYILLNVAVGGNWPGYPDETTILPQKMVIDYVKVYQKVP